MKTTWCQVIRRVASTDRESTPDCSHTTGTQSPLYYQCEQNGNKCIQNAASSLTWLIHIRILESWCHMRALAWNAIHDYVGQTGFEPAHSLLFRSHNPARQTKFASAHMDEHEHSMITMRSYHLRIKETGTSGLPYFHVMRYVQCIHDDIRMIPANF